MTSSRKSRKDPSDRAVRAFTAYGVPAGQLDPSVITETDVHVLLAAVADALNALERSGRGMTVKLAHGAVLTPAGYVLPVYPDAGERFAVRTMALTEFPVPAGDDEDLAPIQVPQVRSAPLHRVRARPGSTVDVEPHPDPLRGAGELGPTGAVLSDDGSAGRLAALLDRVTGTPQILLARDGE